MSNIKNAKTYAAFRAAQEDRKAFFEKTMDGRIAAQVNNKIEAQLKTIATGPHLLVILYVYSSKCLILFCVFFRPLSPNARRFLIVQAFLYR